MRLSVPFALAVVLASPAAARVVSYAPVTNRYAVPIQQLRASPRFVLVESDVQSWWGYYGFPTGRLVVHDASGGGEPRVVLPTTGPEVLFEAAAARRGADGVLRILALINRSAPGTDDESKHELLFSRDEGLSWTGVSLPSGVVPAFRSRNSPYPDRGGPVVRSRNMFVKIGSESVPFILAFRTSASDDVRAIVAIDGEGIARTVGEALTTWVDLGSGARSGWAPRLVGTSGNGGSVLVIGSFAGPGATGLGDATHGLWRVGTTGGLEKLIDLPPGMPQIDAWLTSTGSAYLDVTPDSSRPALPPFVAGRGLYLVERGAVREIATAQSSPSDDTAMIAIPTYDGDGAWVARRGLGRPTTLSLHTATGGLVEKWSDPTAPEIEALHAGASGRKVLVQVHRTRPQMDERPFVDPALAVWEEGEAAPARYDELYLNEKPIKGFVYLDVESVKSGAPFVFDAGPLEGWCCSGAGPSGGDGSGGADVVQEWGVVKASLRQRLVIPAVARTGGEGGAFWKSDLVLGNPGADSLELGLRYVPEGGDDAREATLTLLPGEIRVVPDLLDSLFDVGAGSGALFLSPAGTRVVSATTRTYAAAAEGTYGVSLGAVDLLAASSARFPLAFSGAFPGWGFRTNVGTVDVAGRGSAVGLRFASESGWSGRSDLSVEAEAGGTKQLNRVGTLLGIEPWRAGALRYQPSRGESIPFVTTIDDKTNDPTAWRPDLPIAVSRAIPALVHADGQNGARFRSDLFVYNDSDAPASVSLAAKPWNATTAEKRVTLTLFPREAKVVRDALPVIFQLDGVARLRFVAGDSGTSNAVRVTSRAYTVRPDGGTYGVPLPPLNAFQIAGAGETLELFGVFGGPSFRTNLALVDMTPVANRQTVRCHVEVIADGGTTLDAFDVNVPVAGGIQIDDLFRARGLGDGPAAALVRVSPDGGLVGAYATSIDQGTNDASLVPAALAARD